MTAYKRSMTKGHTVLGEDSCVVDQENESDRQEALFPPPHQLINLAWAKIIVDYAERGSLTFDIAVRETQKVIRKEQIMLAKKTTIDSYFKVNV